METEKNSIETVEEMEKKEIDRKEKQREKQRCLFTKGEEEEMKFEFKRLHKRKKRQERKSFAVKK